jgi:hypothetical protein
MRLLLTIAFMASLQSFAQENFFRSDAGIGAAFTTGRLKSYGISASVEPKFFFNEKISVGLRLEGDVLFGGNISGESSEVSVGMSSRAAFLGKGEYYLGENNTRLFFGAMAGMYTQANIGGSGSGSASISAGRSFGVAPEVGVTFGNFRISGIYHIVMANDIVSISVGETATVSRSYFVVQLGFRAFGINDQ